MNKKKILKYILKYKFQIIGLIILSGWLFHTEIHKLISNLILNEKLEDDIATAIGIIIFYLLPKK